MFRSLLAASLVAFVSLLGVAGFLHWTINRIYVEDGESVMLRYKGPLFLGTGTPAVPGQFAQPGEVGILEEMLGPGRHFRCPLWWETTRVADLVLAPGEVAVVTNKLGSDLPANQFLVDGELDGPNRAKQKGILRKVLGPGRYRIHPYAFEYKIIKAEVATIGDQIKHSGWVDIPTGYVGVVTFLTDNKAAGRVSGIQDQVLPPGLYAINPKEQHVDIIEVGFRESSFSAVKQKDRDGEAHDESGEPLAVADSGISFPSSDGFNIQIDFTAIWGVMPKEAPAVVRTFGSLEQAEKKVIQPQSESICRNTGSRMSAVELLVGDTRQQFQLQTSKSFQDVLRDKHLTLLYGLVRHIYIPLEVRVPIQQGYIADELALTREQERKATVVEADLEEARKKVELEAATVGVETDKLVANLIAEGERKAMEIEADTKRQIAQIERQIAEIDAKRTVELGKATAQAQQWQEEAKAQKFELAVKAFGSAEAYSRWQFAEGLPETMDLKLFYAGEGTLWTDLQSIQPTLPLRNPPANTTGK